MIDLLFPKRTMPTRVDVAAEAAQNAVADAVQQIESNLASSPAQGDDDQNLPSPLFQDEVQQQEMRYLDSVLLGDRPAADDGTEQPKNEGSADGVDRCKETVGPTPQGQQRQSIIASILSPYDRRDDDEKKEARRRGKQSESHANKKDSAQDVHNKRSMQNKARRCTPNPNSHPFGRKLQEKISSLVHHRPHRNNKRWTHSPKHARTAAPSRNRRHQLNNKLIQRAQRSSRRAIAKMVRLGRRCVRNLSTVKTFIHDSVKVAVGNAHSMLEETSAHSATLNADCRRGAIDGKSLETASAAQQPKIKVKKKAA